MNIYTFTVRVARMTKAIAIDIVVNEHTYALTFWRDKRPSFEVVR